MLATPNQRIKLPYPHPGQQHVRQHARRFNWLSAGRRWRKTTLAMSIAIEAAISGGDYIWGAPTFDQVRIGFAESRRALGGVADFNLSRMTAVLPGGGRIVYRSLDNPDNVRGHTADGVVIDEAAFCKQAAWLEVLRPMLIDTGGWLWAIFTPNGRNWVYTEWHNAADRADSVSWQVPTIGVKIDSDGRLVRDPHPLENPDIPFDEILNLYQTMPERIFQQEILAVFTESSAGVFRRVMDAAIATPQDERQANHQYVIGVDWGRHHDFTALTVVDITTKELVYIDRFTQIDYGIQISRLKALYERFRPGSIEAEQNSMGEPLIEQLRRDGLPVRGFQTTNATKELAIRALEGAFERGEIRIINDPVLIGELQAYEQEQLPAGRWRFTAPEGLHDDYVMSLAIAWYSVAAHPPPAGAIYQAGYVDI